MNRTLLCLLFGMVTVITSFAQPWSKYRLIPGNTTISLNGEERYLLSTHSRQVVINGVIQDYAMRSWVLSNSIGSLNTLTAGTQTFATGTSGSDFNISSSTSTHTFNIPTASGSNRGALSSSDWTTFNNKVSSTRTISTTAPLTGGGDLSANRTFGIDDAVADGSTKGAASFTANDFNSSSGNMSLDYTNGQAASGSNKGFLTSADWTTFNSKLGGSGVADRLGVWSGTGTMTSFSNVTRNSSTGAVTIDNVEIDGNSVDATTGDLTLDGPGNIVLDGASGAWITSGPLKFTSGEIVEGASNQYFLTLNTGVFPLEVEYTERDIKRTVITFSGSTYMNIDGTPQNVIAAPGAGKYINIISAVVERHLDAGAYTITCTGDLGLKYSAGTSAQALFRVDSENIELSTSTNRYYKFFEASHDAYTPQGEILENSPIVITILDGGSISSTIDAATAITLKIVYTIEDTF